MKILFVTSETTYIPGNYLDLIKALLEHSSLKETKWAISGVFAVKTLDLGLVKTMVGLPLLGVHQLTSTLVKNTLELPLKKREKLCAQNSIPYRVVKSMNDPIVVDWVKENNIDLILNLRTRCIYKSEILNAPKLGCLNIHHGLLPQYRGTFCDLYALAENRPAGFSLHKMEKKVDAGEIFKVVQVDNGLESNYRDYLQKTIVPEVECLINFFDETAERGSLPQGTPNIGQEKSFTKNPTKKTIQTFKERGMIL